MIIALFMSIDLVMIIDLFIMSCLVASSHVKFFNLRMYIILMTCLFIDPFWSHIFNQLLHHSSLKGIPLADGFIIIVTSIVLVTKQWDLLLSGRWR